MSKHHLVGLGPYTVERSSRKTLGISVLPDGSVVVTAPRHIRLAKIEGKLLRKLRWVRRQKEVFIGLQATKSPKRYCSGATHIYLGRQYRLKVKLGKPIHVALRGAYIEITVLSKAPERVKEALTKWYRDHAEAQFSERLRPWAAWCASRGLPEPRLFIRAMPKRWGSAHADGRIYLNPDLIKAPSPCVEYVICHEVIHLRHRHHDRAFFAALSRHLPNWRVLKQRLESCEL